MAHPAGPAEDDIEIVDSGHQASTTRTDDEHEEFWVVVHNSGDTESVTVELELVDEHSVLAVHKQTTTIGSEASQRYRFVVGIPPGFDQYVFSITDRNGGE